MTSWREEKRAVAAVARIDVVELHARQDAVQILDVRERAEWESGHLPGSRVVPYHDIHDFPDGLEAYPPIAVICSSGQRSAVAASLLQRAGAAAVVHVADGGVGTWERHGWPLERAPVAAAPA
jgi:hydroxyacylglutathione hydrolase